MQVKRKFILVLIIPFIILAVIYPFLPARIPRQFHMDGTTSYMAKEYIFFLGIIPVLIYSKYGSRK